MESLSDELLVRQVLDGTTEAFGVLVKRYERQIYSLAYRLTNDSEEAQDLGQEAFIKIYRSLDKYDPGRPFFSWMYKVAANQCYSMLRQKREAMTSLDEVADFVPSDPEVASHPELYAENAETRRRVREALAGLPENYRMPLVLRYLEDLSYREIAEMLDLSLSAVESRIHRGRQMLISTLDGAGPRGK